MIRTPVILVLLALLFSPAFVSQAQSDPQTEIQSHAKLAKEALRVNNSAAALEEYQAILKIDPRNLEALANVGVLEFFGDDFAQATEQLRAALVIQPDVPKLRALLGMSEKRLGEVHAAQSDLQAAFSAVEEQKLRVQTGMELIEVDYALNDLGKAAEVVNTLRQLRPADPDVLFTAHRIYSDLADESTLALAMVAPQSARMKQLMAHELARRADNQGAIADYRAAIALDPKLPDLHFELADMLYGSSSPAEQAEAEKEYKLALKLNPFDQKSLCRLGDLASKRSDTKAAFDYYSRAYRLQPNSVDANLGLAKILMSTHQPREAEVHLERAVQVEPYEAVIHYRLGVVYRELAKPAEAKHEFAEFEKLKKMKNNLQSVYQAMRLQPGKQNPTDSDTPQ